MARAKNMQALGNDIRAEFPGVTIWGIGDEDHKLRRSDHNEDDTAGVLAAQSDSDTNPEHRAIDIKIDAAFTRADAYKVINRILTDPRLKARLWYINFENYQWSRASSWTRIDNSDDLHPGHIHFSGIASNDEDASSWFTDGGNEMLKDEQLTIPGETLLTGEVLPPGGGDDEHVDAATAVAFGLRHAYAGRRAAEEALRIARDTHVIVVELLERLDALPPGGTLPRSVALSIPAHTVTANINP